MFALRIQYLLRLESIFALACFVIKNTKQKTELISTLYQNAFMYICMSICNVYIYIMELIHIGIL